MLSKDQNELVTQHKERNKFNYEETSFHGYRMELHFRYSVNK